LTDHGPPRSLVVVTARDSAPYVVISVDCHTGAPAHVYRDHLDPQFRDEYDRQVASTPGPINADVDAFEQYFRGNSRHLAPPRRDGADGQQEDWPAQFRAAYARGDGMWESANRLRALEADGVVGEVLYPASQMTAGVPFGPTSGGAAGSDDPELVAAGVLAYNRWLAELCAEAPARHAGIAQTAPLSDVDHVVDAVVFAAEHDLRGGIGLPALGDGGVAWHHPSCDRIWARCQEAGLPINLHGGLVHDRTTAPVRTEHVAPPYDWFADVPIARRPLWHFIVGGVLDRFPRLQLVFTEQLTAWVPEELEAIDRALASLPRSDLELTAREYWARNGYVGATFLSRAEVAARGDVGVDRIMFGTDFPHPEGTYPFTREALRHTFADVPRDELRAMLGETAARVYGFDLAALELLAGHYGPSVDEIAAPLDDRPRGSLSLQWR
jgi:predicted TIM-barrel fold metal-dependent hydrolase